MLVDTKQGNRVTKKLVKKNLQLLNWSKFKKIGEVLKRKLKKLGGHINSTI